MPRPVGASPVGAADYPAEAFRNRKQGSVAVALDVAADGKVTGCSVTQSSGSPGLDAAACPILMKRARFTPARNAAGAPAPGLVVERVVWRIGPDGARHGEVVPVPDLRPPLRPASLAQYFSADDYPADALRRREKGRVDLRLDIGANGGVSACTIIGSSGSASLDAATCRIALLRARFAAARDSAGNAVPDSMSAHIEWRLGRR
jgi:TonB family protein